MQYRTDENSRILATNFVHDTSIDFMLFCVEVGRVDEVNAYVYVGSVG